MHDVLEALADKLTGGVAGDLTQRVVDEHPVTVPVEQPRPDRSPLEDLLEVILGPVCKLLRLPARGDVEHDDHAASDNRIL